LDVMEPALDPRAIAVLHSVAGRSPQSYLVGGALRDYLMGKRVGSDLDLAVEGDGFVIAADIAALHVATFVPLDESHGTARIVLKTEEPIIVDISSLKGPDILADLEMRDFTVNAIALSIEYFLEGRFDQMLDPCGGIPDIRNKTIRICSDNSYRDDSLRILRAFRFMAGLGFRIEPHTLELIPAELDGLSWVAPERIRDEFVATLAADSSCEALQTMDATGVLQALFPELQPMRGCGQNEFHHLDVWSHSLETVRQMESLVRDADSLFGVAKPLTEEYLREGPVKGRPRIALLKLAALFHDSGKPQTRFVEPGGRVRFFGHEKLSREIFEFAADRLKLAKKEISLVGDLVEGHMRPMIFTGEPVSKRAVLRLHRRFHKDIIGLFLLFLADLAATRGPARTPESEEIARNQVIRALDICLEAEKTKEEPFVNGRDMMQLFGLKPGPHMGSILKRLRELQDLGDITSKAEAMEAAREMLQADESSGDDCQNDD
jgi:poly(A) polymerase